MAKKVKLTDVYRADPSGDIIVRWVKPDADGRLLGQGYPMRRMTREEIRKEFPDAD